MFQDYAHRYASVTGGRQRVLPREEAGSKENSLFWKVSGIAITVLMILGLVASYWVGWKIRNGLTELARKQTINQTFSGLNKEVMLHRSNLLALENFEVTAGKLGLYQPTERQVKYP